MKVYLKGALKVDVCIKKNYDTLDVCILITYFFRVVSFETPPSQACARKVQIPSKTDASQRQSVFLLPVGAAPLGRTK